MSFSPHIPNMRATCSLDEYVKIWDIAAPEKPKLVSYKKLASGELFSLSFYKDIPWVLAAGGSKGEVAVWDTEENEAISKHFAGSLDKSLVPEEEEDEEEEDDSEEEEKTKKKKLKKEKLKQVNKIAEGLKKARELR